VLKMLEGASLLAWIYEKLANNGK